jgi:hypothetical protein
LPGQVPASRKKAQWLLAVVAIAIVCMPLGAVAYAAPAPGANPSRSLSVDIPVSPATLSPGGTYQVPIRIINSGFQTFAVTVKGEGIHLKNNGKVSFTNQPDPFWAKYTTFPSGDITIPAQNYVTVPITVRMPVDIKPDFYYIGFLVTPIPTFSGRVILVNQIGDFLVVNVPGPRVMKLSAQLTAPVAEFHLGSVVIGNEAVGELYVRNAGKTAVTFWGENDVSTAFDSTPTQERFNSELLPIGRSRTRRVSATHVWPIDFVTMKVSVFYYGRTGASTKQVVLTKSVLVINLWVIVVACVLVAFVVCWLLYAWHRRHRSSSRRRR